MFPEDATRRCRVPLLSRSAPDDHDPRIAPWKAAWALPQSCHRPAKIKTARSSSGNWRSSAIFRATSDTSELCQAIVFQR